MHLSGNKFLLGVLLGVLLVRVPECGIPLECLCKLWLHWNKTSITQNVDIALWLACTVGVLAGLYCGWLVLWLACLVVGLYCGWLVLWLAEMDRQCLGDAQLF